MSYRIRIHALAATIAAALLTLTAAPAFACAFFEGGWSLLAAQGIPAPVDGPIVVMVNGEAGTGGGVPAVSIDNFTVTLLSGETEVPGSARLDDTVSETSRRLVFVPDEPLTADSEYVLDVVFDGQTGQFGSGVSELSLPIELLEATESVPVITQFNGSETKVGVDRICCDLGQDNCKACGGASACQSCWNESWTYPVSAGLTWEFADRAIEQYDFEVYRLDGDGNEELMSTILVNYQLAGWLEYPEDWSGERCARVDAVHFETGEVLAGDVQCLDGFDVVDRDPNPPPEYSDQCTSQPLDEDGNPAGAKSGLGCCSTAAAPSRTPALFLLLAALLLWRRRP